MNRKFRWRKGAAVLNWNTLLSTFGLVFIAELGDKTQLAVLTQTCKHRQPWPIFWGASLALTAVSALGVIGGQVLGQLVPLDLIRAGAALAFIVMGLLIGYEALSTAKASETGDPAGECVGLTEESSSVWDWKAFGATFGLLFLAEMGDKTQLAVFSLAGQASTPWPILTGGALALTAVTALSVVGGQGLCALLPERALRALSAVLFLAMGALIGLGVF
jgi:putative Ca2+/H+ antiporter (TMEM165/GDT1 family)